MPRAGTRALLKRTAFALLPVAALLVATTVALVIYARVRLSSAEGRYLRTIEARVIDPRPSSTERLEFTERFLVAAAEVSEAWPPAGPGLDAGSPETLALLESQIEVFLGAAVTTPAHETVLKRDEQAVELLRAARLLAGTAEAAAGQGDDARQALCAEALAAIAEALYQRTSLIGMILGTAVAQMELSIVQQLVEEPATSPQALARAAALLEVDPPPVVASFAREALQLVRFERPADERGWATAPLAPLRSAIDDLLRARTLERFGGFIDDLDEPLTEMLAAEPDGPSEETRFDVMTMMVLPNTRDAFIEAKVLEEVCALGREALASRRAGGTGEVSRPDILAALDRYWKLEEDQELPPGPARTRALLTWRVAG